MCCACKTISVWCELRVMAKLVAAYAFCQRAPELHVILLRAFSFSLFFLRKLNNFIFVSQSSDGFTVQRILKFVFFFAMNRFNLFIKMLHDHCERNSLVGLYQMRLPKGVKPIAIACKRSNTVIKVNLRTMYREMKSDSNNAINAIFTRLNFHFSFFIHSFFV